MPYLKFSKKKSLFWRKWAVSELGRYHKVCIHDHVRLTKFQDMSRWQKLKQNESDSKSNFLIGKPSYGNGIL